MQPLLMSDEDPHIGYLIHEVSRRRRWHFDARLKPLNITRAQLVTLISLQQLAQKQRVLQKDLAEFMGVSEASLGEKIGLLITKDLVKRQVDDADRRRRILSLTPAGTFALQTSRSVVETINNSLLNGIDEEQLDITERTLRTIIQNIDKLSD